MSEGGGANLFSDDDVQVVLGLVNVGAHGDDARHSVRISLGWSGGWGVHDGELGGSEEISGTAETVQHSGAHDAGGVCVGVDVNLDWGVHSDDTETSDDLGRVGDDLGTEEEFVVVAVPVVVESLESLWREADGSGGGEAETARVKEVEEVVLENFGPDAEVLEFRVDETTNDGVGNVTDTGLEGEEVLWETTSGNLISKELDEMLSDGLGGVVLWGVWSGSIWEVGVNNGDNSVWVDWNVVGTDTVLWGHDEVWLAVWWKLGGGDIVETLKVWHAGVDFDDDLVGHLDQLWGSTDGWTANDTSLLGNCGSLNTGNIDSVGWTVLGVESVGQILWEHTQMLVKEVDATLVDTLGNGLSNLMRSTTVNHVQIRPSVLSIGTRRGTNEKRISQLTLEVVLLNMVGKSSWHSLWVSNTSESRPSNESSVGEMVKQILWLSELLEESWTTNSRLEESVNRHFVVVFVTELESGRKKTKKI